MIKFLFSPYGRAARADYWYWLIVPALVVAVVVSIVGPFVFGERAAEILLLSGFVAFGVSHTVVAIKRLHDQSLSGWYATALILPFLAGAAVLGSPDILDPSALERAPDDVRLAILAVFTCVFAPFAYILGLIWFREGKDGMNRYGRDPLYR